jgi:prevent-host-death family protein
MDCISTEDFRAGLGQYLDRVYFGEERFVVTRNGLPFVIIAPVPPGTDPDKVRRANAKSIRLNFAELCGMVRFKGEALLVIRRGKPTALFTAPNDPSPGIIH